MRKRFNEHDLSELSGPRDGSRDFIGIERFGNFELTHWNISKPISMYLGLTIDRLNEDRHNDE